MTFQGNYGNDKPDLREPIPAGTPLFLQMTYAPGGAGTEAECGVGSAGALTKSKPPSDVLYLRAEFTVLRGPYKGRKFWSNMTVSGGEVDEKGRSKAGEITRKNIRMILDSSQGIPTKDESPEAMAKRVITGYKDLQGRKFVAKAKVEPAQNGYPAKNGLGQILTVDMKDYPTEAQLDAPATQTAAPAAPPAPPPAWNSTAPVSTPAAPPATPAPAAATVAAPVDNGLPNWAKAA